MSESKHYPLTKLSERKYVEGYWYDGTSLIFPKPKQEKTKDSEFIEKFKKVMELRSNKNFEPKMIDTSYRGFSSCRLCDNSYNGSHEYDFEYDNNRYYFPEGYLHYLEKHNVHPSDVFRRIVLDIYERNKNIV
jgi:hypothetical protein